MLLDTRPGAARFQRRLRDLERTIYLFCDTTRSLPAIVRHAATACSSGTNAADIKKLLDRWTAERLVANADGRYLSLAVRQPPLSRCQLAENA